MSGVGGARGCKAWKLLRTGFVHDWRKTRSRGEAVVGRKRAFTPARILKRYARAQQSVIGSHVVHRLLARTETICALRLTHLPRLVEQPRRAVIRKALGTTRGGERRDCSRYMRLRSVEDSCGSVVQSGIARNASDDLSFYVATRERNTEKKKTLTLPSRRVNDMRAENKFNYTNR